MKQLDVAEIRRALIDLSSYGVTPGKPGVNKPAELSRRIAELLTSGAGYCVCYGTNKVLAASDKSIVEHPELAQDVLEQALRGALALVKFPQFAVTPRPMTLEKMDVDGYNLNVAFSHDGKIASREFMTAKCIHFDAATPFVANTYGPNENIREGYPLICDTRRFCRDHAVDPSDLVQCIPNNYNLVIKERYYRELMENYSFAIDLDLNSDVIMVILLNEIAFGVAHGATPPLKHDPERLARRPIRHFEYQYQEESHYEEWYRFYGLDMGGAGNFAGENLSLYYYSSPLPSGFSNVVTV